MAKAITFLVYLAPAIIVVAVLLRTAPDPYCDTDISCEIAYGETDQSY